MSRGRLAAGLLAMTAAVLVLVSGGLKLWWGPPHATEAETAPVAETAEVQETEEAPGYFRADIPLTTEEQASLWGACEEFGVPYELALAVIWTETRYQNITGDGGDSLGYMQIQPRWHKERMDRLGVSDLMEPEGNFRVGCLILSELLAGGETEDALTRYNTGHGGPSEYAARVMGYMEVLELGGQMR